jgi:phenylacetate-coenzyme A ligase PaaK-like adenylate-forming protein
MEPILGATRDHLQSVPLRRLRSTLHHVYANNPVYRREFDAARLQTTAVLRELLGGIEAPTCD